ncbi:lipase family protein [Rhodococcus sp. NPDC003318]|uniref:lipase family protein n=1 Tax=Rhodococcus sp. NPDC003318 TaxID=3364503 RepID=UPI0036C638B8
MLIERSIARSLSAYRPAKPTSSTTFPVYHDLGATLAGVEQQPDPTVAHTLAVAAGYAYSDAETVAMMLARMGLVDNHCLRVEMSVDAMFIRSTAYLIQSSDGSVVILAYRGTEPTNVVNWLTDADVHPDKIAFPFPKTEGADAVEAGTYAVHAGFYRNVRATRFAVVAALQRALQGRSVLDDDEETPLKPMPGPMTTLYLTGHSLGGAMAALMAVMLSVEKGYIEPFEPVFKGAYTFGAPMVGSPEFAAACAAHDFLDRNVLRYVYRKDLVPHLPPSDSDHFEHFGREYRYGDAWRDTSDDPITQMGDLLGLVEAPLGFVASKFRLLRGLPFRFSLNDHGPQHYIAALTPRGTPNEFGDAHLIPAT